MNTDFFVDIDVRAMYNRSIIVKRSDFMKLQVNVSDEMVVKIDEYARKMGVSRSALCSVFIGQGIMSYEKYNDLLKVISDKVLEQAVGERKGF